MIFLDTLTNWMLWLLLVPMVLIFGLIIVAFIIRVVKQVKQYKPKTSSAIDSEQVAAFQAAFGGKDNIMNFTKEMSRLHVEVKDIELVLIDQLKELGASGVLIVGNLIKASFKDRIDYVYQLLEEGKSHE
ncbi:MAG: PTS transporter subunit EIIB [Bacilli bacterium]|nr:PTS transporter subunit EIIB [Bacilli bacterium]